MRRFIFPMKVMKWSTLELSNGISLHMGEDMPVGYIPVYESIEQLVNHHGADCEYGRFQETVKDNTEVGRDENRSK